MLVPVYFLLNRKKHTKAMKQHAKRRKTAPKDPVFYRILIENTNTVFSEVIPDSTPLKFKNAALIYTPRLQSSTRDRILLQRGHPNSGFETVSAFRMEKINFLDFDYCPKDMHAMESINRILGVEDKLDSSDDDDDDYGNDNSRMKTLKPVTPSELMPYLLKPTLNAIGWTENMSTSTTPRWSIGIRLRDVRKNGVYFACLDKIVFKLPKKQLKADRKHNRIVRNNADQAAQLPVASPEVPASKDRKLEEAVVDEGKDDADCRD